MNPDPNLPKKTILQIISDQRKIDVQNAIASHPLDSLISHLNGSPSSIHPHGIFPLVNFPNRLRADMNTGNKNAAVVLAEIKRASPSKGDIAPNADAAKQGIIYAKAGASAISCLTEPTWFKGTLQDMLDLRLALEQHYSTCSEKRPAVLRKDFIVDEYQIYEARVYGADTVLLIVATLTDDQLARYLMVSRKLGMEPLVEVNTEEEMNRALKIGEYYSKNIASSASSEEKTLEPPKVIGINNRNLHTFTVDMETTGRLLQSISPGESKKSTNGSEDELIMVALSGINDRKDVEYFESVGAMAVLVGESLMRVSDPAKKIAELRGIDQRSNVEGDLNHKPVVKICGLKSVEMALQTAEAGADLIGLVFAPGSKRLVSLDLSKSITNAIKDWRKQKYNTLDEKEELNRIFGQKPQAVSPDSTKEQIISAWYSSHASFFRQALLKTKPLVVGVFANQPISEVLEIADTVGLDIIQLSGTEGFSVNFGASQQIYPVIKAVHVPVATESSSIIQDIIKSVEPSVTAVLLDTHDPSMAGGTGNCFNWDIGRDLSNSFPLFLAGGLTPSNIGEAVQKVHPFGVDVSSGVEGPEGKDLQKIIAFISQAKS